MGCVGNKKVQKDYKPEENRQQNQGRPVNSSLNVPGNKPTTSILVDTERGGAAASGYPPQNVNRAGSRISSNSAIREPGGRDKVVQLKQSKIYLKSEKEMDAQSAVSAMRVQGFEGTQYQGKKVRKFNIAANIPDQELVKQSNYFDESNGDLGIRHLVPCSYADLRVGDSSHLNTFPVMTYMFNHNLGERIAA